MDCWKDCAGGGIRHDGADAGDWIHPKHRTQAKIYHYQVAIGLHRKISMEAGREPGDQDIALWSTLEGHWQF